MARTKSGRMITKNIENMTIAENIKYEAETKRDLWGYAQSYTRSSGSTTLERRAGVNVMPKSLFEHLKLADLKETIMVVEMEDIIKKAPLGIVENILVKIDKFLFHSDSIVIDMLEGHNEPMLLGRPLLATIHAQIDVFRREISLGIGTPSYSDESIDTVDSSDDMQELEGSQDDEDDPYSRRFDVYKEEFDNEIEQLVNEYKLKVRRKSHALDEVWEKCEKFHDTTKLWYDKGFKEEELWQNGIEEIDYTLLLVKSETFEVYRYTFKNRKSFISITKQMDYILTLGRVNRSRFMGKSRKEMDEEKRTTRKT
uniref:Reverse transcriptase domain-containing protein n=1 Tax=Tanacetum cinerariifolium TaxID=118510 RepID=A0A6L2MPP6_TANCI|nr:hypothetical protein [Tanacetum cinerariifolium]